MDLNLRPMSISQVLDRTFSLYKNNFVLFAGIAALPSVLILVGQLLVVLGAAAVAILLASLGDFGNPGVLEILGVIAVAIVGVIVFAALEFAATSLATGATVYAVSRTHLGHPVTIAESYRAVLPLIWRVIGITILISLIVGGTMLVCFLVVGGSIVLGFVAKDSLFTGLSFLIGFCAFVATPILVVWLSCMYGLAVPACVVERATVLNSLGRSKFLSKQSRLRIFLIYVLMAILGVVLVLVISIPDFIATFAYDGTPPLPFQVWSFVARFLASTLATPIGTIAIVLIYYDNRLRKEAFDLQLMMESMGQAPALQGVSALGSGT